MHRFDHTRPEFKPYGFTCELWTAAPMRRPDRHNEIELNLLKNGSLSYLFGGRRVTIGHGALVAFWAAIPHQIIGFSGNPAYYVVTIPLAWFLQCRLPAKLVDRLLHGHFLREPNPARVELDLKLFQTWTGERVSEEAGQESAIKLELHARMLRLAGALPEFAVQGRERRQKVMVGEGALSKAEHLAAFIAQHYQDSISIRDISNKVGLHPNYAMNLFKKTFNLTINEYLTQHRLSHAQRLLATTDDKIVDIVLNVGFNTVSRFYKAFEESCNCTPAQYRRLHREEV